MVTPSIGPKKLYQLLNILLDSNTPVFIHGSPGIGKSFITRELANARGWQIRDVRLSQLDPVDLRGIPTIDSGVTKWMPPVFFPQDEDSNGILFLDELNSAPLSVQSAIYQLILDRALGEYKLPKGWRIICAGNRISDKGVVFRLPSPLANRMVHLLLEPKYEDWKIWAIQNRIHEYILAFLSFRADLLSQEPPKNQESNPAFATPRSWAMLSEILSNSPISQIESLVYGLVGYSVGIEFLSYVKVFKELPSIDAILRGEEIEFSNTPSTLYALCSAIVNRFEFEYAEVVFKFSKKLPTEFAVMLIKDIFVKDDRLGELEVFAEWLEKYEDVII